MEEKKLKSFRDNINRGLHNKSTRDVYAMLLRRCREGTPAATLDALRALGKIVR